MGHKQTVCIGTTNMLGVKVSTTIGWHPGLMDHPLPSE